MAESHPVRSRSSTLLPSTDQIQREDHESTASIYSLSQSARRTHYPNLNLADTTALSLPIYISAVSGWRRWPLANDMHYNRHPCSPWHQLCSPEVVFELDSRVPFSCRSLHIDRGTVETTECQCPGHGCCCCCCCCCPICRNTSFVY